MQVIRNVLFRIQSTISLTTRHKMTTSFRILSSKNERKFSSSFLFAVKTKDSVRRRFIAKLNKFTNFNFIFVILWQTRQIKSRFNNKDKNTHRSKVVYKGDFSCGVDYIGKTVRNLAVLIAEHSNPAHTPLNLLNICGKTHHILSLGVFFHSACSFLGTNIPQA